MWHILKHSQESECSENEGVQRITPDTCKEIDCFLQLQTQENKREREVGVGVIQREDLMRLRPLNFFGPQHRRLVIDRGKARDARGSEIHCLIALSNGLTVTTVSPGHFRQSRGCAILHFRLYGTPTSMGLWPPAPSIWLRSLQDPRAQNWLQRRCSIKLVFLCLD